MLKKIASFKGEMGVKEEQILHRAIYMSLKTLSNEWQYYFIVLLNIQFIYTQESIFFKLIQIFKFIFTDTGKHYN